MHSLLLCRQFLLIPALIVLFVLSTFLLVKLIKEKKLSVKYKAITSIVVVITLFSSYFMFFHGNNRQTVVDINDCLSSFDEIVQADLEKMPQSYWGSYNSDYYYTSKNTEQVKMDINVVYGDLTVPSKSILYNGLSDFETLFKTIYEKEKSIDGVNLTASAMIASKGYEGVNIFLGTYSGTIIMTKGNVNVIIDYSIHDEAKSIFCFTTLKPKTIFVSDIFEKIAK